MSGGDDPGGIIVCVEKWISHDLDQSSGHDPVFRLLEQFGIFTHN